MSICIAGALWLASDQSGSGNPTPQGDAMLVVAGLLFASFTVFGKEMRDRYGAVVLNSLAYVSGALLLQPIIWIVYSDVSLTSIPTDGWLAVAYMAIFPSVLGYLIYYWALGHVPASNIARVQYLQPLTATSLGWLFLGESITPTVVLAGAVIMTGVYIAERAWPVGGSVTGDAEGALGGLETPGRPAGSAAVAVSRDSAPQALDAGGG